MILRFLRTTASSNPEYPFRVAQMIQVATLTAEHREWLKCGYVELVRDAGDEVTAPPDPERAVTRKGKR